MAQEQRVHANYFYGVLSLAATISDTSLSSTAFANLPVVSGTAQFIPLVLHNPATGVFEIVWVTGHTAASQTVTVVRGKETSVQQAWPANTQILDAPTYRDLLVQVGLASLPADGHLGMRAIATDQGTAGVGVEKTPSGWGPSVGVALGSQIGPILNSASNPPNDGVIVERAGYFDGLADASANVSVTFRSPFPLGFIGAQITSAVLNTLGPFVIISGTTSGFVARCFNGSTTPVANGSVVRFSYIAHGW